MQETVISDFGAVYPSAPLLKTMGDQIRLSGPDPQRPPVGIPMTLTVALCAAMKTQHSQT